MAKLIRIRAVGGNCEYEIGSAVTTIGRLSTNDIQLNDASVSKNHARLTNTGWAWRLEDLGTSNGTFVNGKQITSCSLATGDAIVCGSVKLQFEADRLSDSSAINTPEIFASMSIVPPRAAEPPARRANMPSDTLPVIGPPGTTDEHPAEKKLRIVQLIGEKTIKTLDLDKLVNEILSIVMEQTGASRGFICRLEKDGSYSPLATRGFQPGAEPRISRTVLKQLLEEKSGVLIRQATSQDARASLRAMAVEATLCVPLWTTDEIMGCIALDRLGEGQDFNKSDLDLLMAVAHQAAIGIERARLAKVAEQELSVRSYLSQYLDSKLVQQIAENRTESADPLAPAERELTILFSDVVSFTKMCEGLKPTEVSHFVRNYLTAMTEIIFAHHGTIDKYIGDAIMALFGAPVASKDAARSAINAAIEMREFVSQMEPPSNVKSPFRVRFGIVTGPAVVGNIGSAQRVEYTALGDTVNLASRLQSFARPQEICIDEYTLSKVGPEEFTVQEIGTIDVKNRAQPVRVFKVLG